MSALDWQTRLALGHPDAIDRYVAIGLAAERAEIAVAFAAAAAKEEDLSVSDEEPVFNVL